MGAFSKILSRAGRRFLLAVEDSSSASDYIKYENLREAIWGFPEDNLPGSRNMMCENYRHEGSSLYLGLYAEDEGGRILEDEAHLIGFSYGFVGIKMKPLGFRSLDNLWFYSQYTGVRPEFQGLGLGVALKEYQREVLLDALGINTVTCTFDPLTAVNARRNIHHFRMDVLDYKPATYGQFGGFLNRADVPSDRLFASWDLEKCLIEPDPAAEVSLAGLPDVIDAEDVTVPGRSGAVSLERVSGLRLDSTPEYLRLRVPRDFYLMLRETDVPDPGIRKIPLEWRMAVREAFQNLFGRGYKVLDFGCASRGSNDFAYVLGTQDPPRPAGAPARTG